MGLDYRSRHGINLSVGTLLAQTGTVVLSNSNGVSFGMILTASSYVVTMSGGGGVAVLQTISAGSTLISSGEVVLANSGGFSFGINGNTITAGFAKVSYWDNLLPQNSISVHGSSSTRNFSAQRILVPRPIDATRADLLMHMTLAGSTAGSFTLSIGLYTMAGSTASLASSATAAVSWNSGTNSTAASIYGGQSGTRWRSIPLSWNVSPGEYMLGFIGSVSGVAGTTATMTVYGQQSAQTLSGTPSSSQNVAPYFAAGAYSVGVSGLPASIHLTDLIQVFTATALGDRVGQPYVQLAGTF